MIIKQLIDEDFSNYKKPSMFIAFPLCDWKCEKECGMQVCQNSTLANQLNIEIEPEKIVKRYLNNSITSAIVCGGLEPFNSACDLCLLIHKFRQETNDDIIIQTGYTEEELEKGINKAHHHIYITSVMIDVYKKIKEYNNIIIKFGRFVPNQEPHYDEVLGIKLASNNQYGKIISKEHHEIEN